MHAFHFIQVKSSLMEMCSAIQLPCDKENVLGLDESPPAKCSKLSAWDLLLGQEEPCAVVDHVKEECQKYASEKHASRDSDPLKWWAVNASHYPSLSVLAKKYLCVPATSAPSERVFSAAGLTVSHTRNSLSPSTVDSLLFLSKNFDVLHELV
jgi:hypothetical protein